MSEEEISENLEIIKFDSKIHRDVKDAMRNLIKSDKYVEVMTGKKTDAVLVEEVQQLLDAYHKLKDLPQEEILRIASLKSGILNGIDEEEYLVSQFIYEVIIDRDENKAYHILKKNVETNEYEELNTLSNAKFYKTSCCFWDEERIYNLFGDVIVCDKELLSSFKRADYYDKIYRIQTTDKIFYVSFSGNILYNSDDTLYSKNISDLFISASVSRENKKENNLTYHNFVDMFKHKRKYNFLNTWKINEIRNNYILLDNKNDQAYYRVDGSLVIDTLSSDYVSLGTLGIYSNNIIKIARYDGNLVKKYGYYSLDRGYEIEPTRNKDVSCWINNYGVCRNETDTFIVKNNDDFKRCQSFSSVILANAENKELKRLSKSIYKFYNDLYAEKDGKLERFFLDNYYFEDYDELDFLVVRSKNDDAIFVCYDGGRPCPSNVIYALNIEEDEQGEYDIWRHQWRFMQHSNLAKRIMEDNYKPMLKSQQNVLLNLEKSSFTTSSSRKNNSSLLENSKSLVIKEDKNISKALAVLIESGVISESQAQSLILKEDWKQELQVARKDEILGKDINSFHGLNHKLDITEIVAFSEDGSVVWVKAKEGISDSKDVAEEVLQTDYILDRKTKKVINNPNYHVISLDQYGNFVVERFENSSNRLYLLNSRKGTLIGAKMEINSPQYGIYITRDDNDKYQAYDMNGEEKIKDVDRLKWQNKFFISEDGRVVKNDSVLILENFGYVYALEEDGDKLIRLPQKNLDVLDLLFEDQKILELKNRDI